MALRDQFLAGMSTAACTVSIVTTDGTAGRQGATVSAMSSVSADTPQPTLLVCINETSATAQAIKVNGVFCVNLLRDDQSGISDCFAKRWTTGDGDKFSCATWVPDVNGSPRVVDGLVAFSCTLSSWKKIGTHYVFFGEVQDVALATEGSPLIYANRAYRSAVPIAPRSAPASGCNAS
ncbi:flavin reductase family protein [Tardiphaga robiniae]|nr:flavin reductase family protein [Tardiphaga robiniae]